jgi:hypothetical protein
VLAVGADRQHGANDGYDDDPDAHHSWDSTVPNGRVVQVGDRIVLWDKYAVIGASVIETIEAGTSEKTLNRCPHCELAGIKARKGMSPRFKCYKCSRTFDDPVTYMERVDTYRSRHDAYWVDLERCIDGALLRSLCESPRSQLSMRSLRWAAFCAALQDVGRGDDPRLLSRFPDTGPTPRGGHREARVRLRLGQATFRRRLLGLQGAVCAFTGPAPEAALEAAHLYSYAEFGVHHDHGGLLLRRDIHRLFDRGDLAVNPDTLTVSIREPLRRYPGYAVLDGRPLLLEPNGRQREWLRRHWVQHRDPSPVGQRAR